MNGLIEKDKSGRWMLKGVPWECLNAGSVLGEEVRQKLYGALCKLKDYEATGLSTDQAAGLEERWILVDAALPEDDSFVLMSFENCSLPMVGRYEHYEDGSGNWYIGDCDEEDTCLANDLYVNAWRPLPKCYRGGEE